MLDHVSSERSRKRRAVSLDEIETNVENLGSQNDISDLVDRVWRGGRVV